MYLIYDSLIFECKFITEAIDLCFKLCNTLKIEYPFDCIHLYSHLESFIYEVKNTKKKTVAQTIIGTLKINLDKHPKHLVPLKI